MFQGIFKTAMDDKGRTSLPAAFREELLSLAPDEKLLVITQGFPDKCLWCQPPAAWTEFAKAVRAKPQFKPEIRTLMRAFVAPAQPCAFDKLGRILIPQSLRDYAGLQGEVVWSGFVDRIELWNAETWKKQNDEILSKPPDEALLKALGELGL